MNEYDAATPVGHEPREGREPRVRRAVPGSTLDAVYASRYRLLGTAEVSDDVTVALEVEQDVPTSHMGDLEDEPGTAHQRAVDQALADELPPSTRRRNT